ncbi:hypothetical protein [Enterococcus sp. AZ109]|uniref:hypothetical protein n=1 Tax=Enterococcus sp. AZ109 TaxID=2774634 RepID=UPI003F227768
MKKRLSVVSDATFLADLWARNKRLISLGGLGLLLQGAVQIVKRLMWIGISENALAFISGLSCALIIVSFISCARHQRIIDDPALLRKRRQKYSDLI